MTIRLNGTEDFSEFCENVQLFNDYEGKAQLSTWFGQSSFRWTFLRSNLELVIFCTVDFIYYWFSDVEASLSDKISYRIILNRPF